MSHEEGLSIVGWSGQLGSVESDPAFADHATTSAVFVKPDGPIPAATVEDASGTGERFCFGAT